MKKDYGVPEVRSNNIKEIDIYSENDELVYVIDESKQIEKILNKYKCDSDNSFYVDEYDTEHDTYDVYLLFNDGLLNYFFGYISEETLNSWKSL